MADDKIVLEIGGMGCDACVRTVTQALEEVPGVVRAEVDLAAGRAIVRGDLGPDGAAKLVSAVEEAGYSAKLAA
jgi:copper chaperone CopZ